MTDRASKSAGRRGGPAAERPVAADDRAHGEGALGGSEARYRTLFETIDEGFGICEVVVDAQGAAVDLVFREVNAAFERHTRLADVVGRSVRETMPQVERYWLELLSRVARTGVPERFEGFNEDIGRWFRGHYSRVGGEGSRLVAVVFEDVTERRLAEEATRERDERQAFLLALSDALRARPDERSIEEITVTMLGEHLRLDRCYVSEVFEEEGYSTVGPEHVRPGLPSMVGRYRLADYPETQRQLATQPLVIDDAEADPRFSDEQKATLALVPQRALMVAPVRKGPEIVWALAGAMDTPRRWTEGDRALFEEVAERTWAAVERARAEASLRASEEQFRRSIEEAPIPVIMHAEDGEVLQVSRTWTELTGYDIGDVPTFDAWLTHAYGEGADAVREHVHALFAGTRRTMSVEFPVRTLAGEVRHWSFSASAPGTLHDGRRFVVGMALDVTERRRVEEAAERERSAQARDELRRQLAAAEEAERRRLARELHDQVGQHLTAFALGLAEVRRLLAAGHPAAPRLAQLEALAQLMTRDARYLALELRPPELDDMGLEYALDTYVREWSARYGVAAEVALRRGAGGVPPEVASALYRIAQEALTNVAKHAGARQVSVILERADGEVRLIVEDDGRGFDVDAAAERARAERRLGLAGMRERAALVGGTVAVESSDDHGATLYVRLPVSPVDGAPPGGAGGAGGDAGG